MLDALSSLLRVPYVYMSARRPTGRYPQVLGAAATATAVQRLGDHRRTGPEGRQVCFRLSGMII